MANIIEITDFEAPELDVFTRLTENQLLNRHEPEKGIFIAESPKNILWEILLRPVSEKRQKTFLSLSAPVCASLFLHLWDGKKTGRRGREKLL